jgi:hypothetical protein
MNGRLGGRPRKDGTRPAGSQYANGIGRAGALRASLNAFLKANRAILDSANREALEGARASLAELIRKWSRDLKSERP